jgi:hypothetical protein
MSKGLLALAFSLVAGAGASLAQTPVDAPAVNPLVGAMVDPTDVSPAQGPHEAEPPRPQHLWGGVEYLLWWVKDGPLPYPLVTTGPGDADNPGALGHGGVPFLTGPNVGYDNFSGVRATIGGWFDGAENCLGVELSGFLSPQSTKTRVANSDANGNPVVAFRYLDPPDENGVTAEDAFQAAVPPGNPSGVGPFAGGVAVISRTRLWGSEFNGVVSVFDVNPRLQLLGGFRYADLEENLELDFTRGAIDPGMVFFQGTSFAAPSVVSSTDNFHVRNQFYGGQVGLRGEYHFGRVFVAAAGKIALGTTHEVLNVSGLSTLITPGSPAMTAPGGQFADLSNSGRFSMDEFAVMPEMQLKLGVQVTSMLRGFVGYNFLYWSRVIRPGNQVDLTVDTHADQIDPAFVAGTTATYPQAHFQHSDFWAQGVNCGLELEF